MNGNKLSLSDYQIFFLKIFGLLVMAWGSFFLALAGFFYASAIWIGTGVFVLLMMRQIKIHRINCKPSLEMLLVSLLFMAIAIFFTFHSTPTVFSGRDQGSISEAAIRLSQNHSFIFQTKAEGEFFKLHQSGRAQNFPGFYYTANGSLVTQFPLVYITWLALFFSLFGLAGFTIANAILLFVFLSAFYLLMRLFVDFFAALPLVLFTSTSFAFMWFSKFTLSENMALALLWVSILALMLVLREQRKLYYTIFLFSSFLLCFTRIEGYAFLLVSIVILLLNHDTRRYMQRKFFYHIFLPALFILATITANIYVDINFFKELVKALLPAVATPQAQYLGNIKQDLPNFFLIKLFNIYGMLSFFVFGFFTVIYFFIKKEYDKLIPLFVILPTFIYFFDSHITPDQPWMLRRYMFSLLPVAIFYSGLLIGQWLEKKDTYQRFRAIALLASFWLLAGNLSSFVNFLTYSENKNLLPQIKTISGNFSANDLVLIDQKATGDGWTMMSGPMSSLFEKNAVYFFNISDLSKLNVNAFDNIYLITPNEQVSFYLSSTIGKKLNFQNDYSLSYSHLDADTYSQEVSLPAKKDVKVQGKIFKITK